MTWDNSKTYIGALNLPNRAQYESFSGPLKALINNYKSGRRLTDKPYIFLNRQMILNQICKGEFFWIGPLSEKRKYSS